MSAGLSRDPIAIWRICQRLVTIVFFGLPPTVCVLTAVLALRPVVEAGWPAVATAARGSLNFFDDVRNLVLVTTSGAVAVFIGVMIAWIVHTRRIRFKAGLMYLFFLPAALPYEAVTWIARSLLDSHMFSDDAKLIAGCVLFYRYLPICLVFSYLIVSLILNKCIDGVKLLWRLGSMPSAPEGLSNGIDASSLSDVGSCVTSG